MYIDWSCASLLCVILERSEESRTLFFDFSLCHSEPLRRRIPEALARRRTGFFAPQTLLRMTQRTVGRFAIAASLAMLLSACSTRSASHPSDQFSSREAILVTNALDNSVNI